MKNVFKVFLLFSLFFINVLYSKTIKISFAKDVEPYYFLDKNKDPKGFLIDYWTLWSKKVNVNVEFIGKTWPQALNMIKNNEADIHAGLLYIKKREAYLHQVGPIISAHLNFYIKRKNVEFIKTVEDLEGKLVSVVKGSHAAIYLKNNYPKLKLKEYISYIKMINSIYKNETDAIFSESLSIWHELIKSSKFSDVIKLSNFEYKTKIYAGLKKEDEELKELVLEGIDKITSNEMYDLEKKWIIDKNLRFFTKKRKSEILTVEERLYLKMHPNLKISFMRKWKKHSYADEKGKLHGFHLDILKQINKNLNIDLKKVSYDSWTKAYSNVLNGKDAAIFGLSWSKKREELFLYSPSYHYTPHNIIVRENEENIIKISDFNKRRLVTQKNNIVEKIIKKELKNPNILYVKTVNDILESISNNRADASLLTHANDYNLKKYKLKNVGDYYTKYGELYIGIHKNNAIFASILSKGIDSISSNEMNKIKSRWLIKKRKYPFLPLKN